MLVVTVLPTYFASLTLYVPFIVTNSTNKKKKMHFCMYLFYNLFATLHVSNDYFVHHQEFINLLYLHRLYTAADTVNS